MTLSDTNEPIAVLAAFTDVDVADRIVKRLASLRIPATVEIDIDESARFVLVPARVLDDHAEQIAGEQRDYAERLLRILEQRPPSVV